MRILSCLWWNELFYYVEIWTAVKKKKEIIIKLTEKWFRKKKKYLNMDWRNKEKKIQNWQKKKTKKTIKGRIKFYYTC
jgi:phosphoribosylformimino-5-aminoimidazole carboxamide ribonucleotide (ProFAR) isomerase